MRRFRYQAPFLVDIDAHVPVSFARHFDANGYPAIDLRLPEASEAEFLVFSGHDTRYQRLDVSKLLHVIDGFLGHRRCRPIRNNPSLFAVKDRGNASAPAVSARINRLLHLPREIDDALLGVIHGQAHEIHRSLAGELKALYPGELFFAAMGLGRLVEKRSDVILCRGWAGHDKHDEQSERGFYTIFDTHKDTPHCEFAP
jgi:hypothetical protein